MAPVMTFDINEWKINCPFRMCVCGSSGAGKTNFVLQLIQYAHYMLTNMPDRIIYCYSVLQPKLENLAKENKLVELHEGFSSDIYENHDPSQHMLLCIDDMMSMDIFRELSDLFTKYSRHKNISVIFLTQVNNRYIYIYI